MTVTAELADGQKLEFPDGTSPEVVQRVVKQQTEAKAKASAAQPKAEAEASKAGVLSFDQIKKSLGEGVNAATAGPQTALAVASGLVAPVVGNIAGLAATGYEAATGNPAAGGGTGDMPAQFKREVEDLLTFNPQSKQAQVLLTVGALPGRAVGAVAGAAGNAIRGGKSDEINAASWLGAAGNATEEGLKQAARILTLHYAPEIAKAGGKITKPVLEQAAKLPGKVGEAARLLSGKTEVAAKAASAGEVKAQASAAQVREAAKAEEELVRTRATRQVQAKLQQQLEQGKAKPLDTHAQGTAIEETFNSAIKVSQDATEAHAKVNYAAADEEAAAREAKGQRPNVDAAKKPLRELQKKAVGTPYEEKLGNVLKMFDEAAAKPDGAALLGELGAAPESRTFGTQAAKGRAIREAANSGADPTKALKPKALAEAGAAPGTGKPFQQLRVVSRILKEMANDPALEGGAKSMLGNALKDASATLDRGLGDFSPKYKHAVDTYRTDMEAVAALKTRYGKAITDTEGGFSSDKSAKVPRQDLAQRVFGKTEGIELYEEAVAGGPHASAEARASAHKLVSDFLEQHVRELVRTKTPEGAVGHLDSAGTRAAMEGSGHGATLQKLQGEAAGAAGKAGTVRELDKALESSRARRAEATERARTLQQSLGKADELAKQGNAVDQKAAFRAYQNILEGMLKDKQITPEAYAGAQRLFSRANTVAEKTARARSIAKWAAATIGLGIADEVIHKAL